VGQRLVGKQISQKENAMKKGLSVMLAWMVLGGSVCFAEEEKSGAWSVGVEYGIALPMAKEAIKGFSESEWRSSSLVGANIMYRWSNGLALEVLAQRYKFGLEEGNNKFGTLEVTPIMLLIKYQGLPNSNTGFAGHGDLGGGIGFGSFAKGGFITNLEQASGVTFDVKTSPSFVFNIGGGPDYFFTRWLSMNADARLLLGNMGTTWSASGPGGTGQLGDVDSFLVSNFQFTAGLRLWWR
jgi:hypothetical protein